MSEENNEKKPGGGVGAVIALALAATAGAALLGGGDDVEGVIDSGVVEVDGGVDMSRPLDDPRGYWRHHR